MSGDKEWARRSTTATLDVEEAKTVPASNPDGFYNGRYIETFTIGGGNIQSFTWPSVQA